MARYLYADHILEVFNVFHRPLHLDEVATYVAEMEAKTVDEVRLAVDNTLTAGWMHGFLATEEGLFTLICGYWDETQPIGGRKGKHHTAQAMLRSS
ncbi:uncharacterized protein LOC120456125 [Drosophila santomea]|uniref:uncharacterized protein LOC120456125 n=1 Tax=Drosophila santomea TaxID=129105 RepID=UPI0019545F81|nr:uncharacterized protein LOC120456125 [Drosophila santomea]